MIPGYRTGGGTQLGKVRTRVILPGGPRRRAAPCRELVLPAEPTAGSSTSETTSLPRPRLDFRSICENVDDKARNAVNRKANIPADGVKEIARLHELHKNLSSSLNRNLHERTVNSKRMRDGSLSETEQICSKELLTMIKTSITNTQAKVDHTNDKMMSLALMLPNDTHPATPIGPEGAAKINATLGPEPLPASEKRDHLRIASRLNMVDFKAASTVTGSSWYYLTGAGVLLENALVQYALQKAIARGYLPVLTPDVVRNDIATRCGFQPRDSGNPPVHQMYHIQNSNPAQPQLVLSGTAEIPLAGMFAMRTFRAAELPMKVVGVGRAFRCEAGARGADTRGLFRVHQFTKVELFGVTTQDNSERMMEEMLDLQLDTFTGLGLPLRVLEMPTEELGASAYRKFDVEAWMPGRGSWGEISSTSNCTDYQARRLHIRYRPNQSGAKAENPTESAERVPLPFAHTLNGTAAAIPRLIVALLENGAMLDHEGNLIRVKLPNVLQPHWLGGHMLSDRIEWI